MIRNKEEVQDVFVEIMELEEGSDWAFSERIWGTNNYPFVTSWLSSVFDWVGLS
ncbi:MULTISPECIES: hypothetical protein [unclassified Paenibacillus]|uniref:hypothetical protein n=1 Tax=unclassified Paenibacillus TaxID=185978 RepID=UPI00363F96AB